MKINSLTLGLGMLVKIIAAVLLVYFFNFTFQSLVYFFACVLSYVIIKQLIVRYANFNVKVFRARFVIFGILYGLFIALLLVIVNFGLKIHSISFMLAIFIGLMLRVAFFYWEKNRLMKKLTAEEEVLTYSKAFCYDVENNVFAGWIFVTASEFCFFDKIQNKVLFRKKLDTFYPTIAYGVLQTPTGFTIQNQQLKFKLRFPLFWVKYLYRKNKMALAN